MHLQNRNELLKDSVKAIHARNLVRDMSQTEDEAYSGIEIAAPYTYCTTPQIVDAEAAATMPPSAASICTLVINAKPLEFEVSDIVFSIDFTAADDDFTDDNPLEIEVKPERQQQNKESLYKDLYKIYRECSELDWDSEGAETINEQTFIESLTLLDMLPFDLPLPEIIPEPSGNIAFEWYKGKKNVYIISVGGKRLIEYAGLFGLNSKTYGVEYFSDEFPELIISHILRLFK